MGEFIAFEDDMDMVLVHAHARCWMPPRMVDCCIVFIPQLRTIAIAAAIALQY